MDLFHVCLYARDFATFFFLPRSNSTHYHKRDLPLITQTNVGLLSLHFQLRRKAKSWLKMLSLLDILPTAGFEFQVISFTWPGSTELVGSNKCFLVLQFHVQKNCMYFVTKIVLTYCEKIFCKFLAFSLEFQKFLSINIFSQ